MATAEQLQQRSEQIQETIKQFSETPKSEIEPLIKTVDKRIRDSVLAGVYELGLVTPSMMTPKQAYRVAEKFLKEAGDRYREMAANRGSEVHNLAERIANGEKVDVPKELEGHIASWQKFVDDWQITFVRTEFTVYSEIDRYAGTGDVLCTSGKDPSLGLICADYKTSQSGIWPDISLQLSALRFAEYILYTNPETGALMRDTETLRQIKTLWGVQITGKGYKVVPVTANAAVFQVFRAASMVARYRTEFAGKVLGDAEFVPNERTEDATE